MTAKRKNALLIKAKCMLLKVMHQILTVIQLLKLSSIFFLKTDFCLTKNCGVRQTTTTKKSQLASLLRMLKNKDKAN